MLVRFVAVIQRCWRREVAKENMRRQAPFHTEKGLLAFLSKPRIYNLFGNIIGKKRSRIRFVQKWIKPFPGCRILDIGCGTSAILSSIPNSIGEYNGFDMNPSYIEFAKKRWKDRANCRFFCQKVEEATISETEYYHIVLAVGILHHLSDSDAGVLFNIANQALKVNGVLITYDNVHVENQHWFAKWFISRDRGSAVRTVDGYKRLAAQYFVDIEGDVLHDTLKVPYTIFTMRCIKRNLTEQLSS